MGRNFHNIALSIVLSGVFFQAPVYAATRSRTVSATANAVVGEIKVVQASFRAGSHIQAAFPVTNGKVIEFVNDFVVAANVTSDLYTVQTKNGYAHWELKKGVDPRTVGTITFPLTIRLPYDREKTTFSVRAWGADGKLAPSSPRTIYIENTTASGIKPLQTYIELRAQGNQELAKNSSGSTATYYSASLDMFFPLKPGISGKVGVKNTGTKDQSYNPFSPAKSGETVNTVSLGVRMEGGQSGILDMSAGWNALPDWKGHKDSWQLQLGYRRSMWTHPNRIGSELQLTSNALNDLGVYGSLDWWPSFVGSLPVGVSLTHVTLWKFGEGSEGLTGLALKARQPWFKQIDAEGTLGFMLKPDKGYSSQYSPTLQGGVSVRF